MGRWAGLFFIPQEMFYSYIRPGIVSFVFEARINHLSLKKADETLLADSVPGAGTQDLTL